MSTLTHEEAPSAAATAAEGENQKSAKDSVTCTLQDAPPRPLSIDEDPLAHLEREYTDAIPCEGWGHGDGTYGHDHEPARYLIAMECPGCEKRTVWACCAGRVALVMTWAMHDLTLKCSTCESRWPVFELWRRIIPLNEGWLS